MTAQDFRDADLVADVTTLAGLARWRAVRQPDRVGYVFLDGDSTDETPVTYGELDRRARAIAVWLRRSGVSEGERALLLYPPGPEFLTAFFGCLYAGVIAVPAYPPDPLRFERTLPRLVATVADATPTAVLSVAPLLALAEGLPGLTAQFGGMPWIATDAVPTDGAGEWTPPGVDGSAVAMLQYTSGSTGTPKGVRLTHRNLLHNSRLIQEYFGTTAESRGLSWLPPYHDMGLIGGLLQPLFGGLPVWLMSPLDFIRAPLSWLHAVSRLGITVSGGPNFAYDLCVRRITPELLRQLDLSAWRVAFNGAEPVRRSSLERFATTFAPAGFRADAFLPCYGLAEATLIVSAGPASSTAGDVDREALARGEVAPAPADSAAVHRLVSCGRVAADHQVAIVDPETRNRRAPGRVGEIWLRGPSVAEGYWGRPVESREIFRAPLARAGDAGRRVESGEEGYLRTGDLGFLRDGELVIVGRLKDLIIIRGRNHYPQDLEATAEQAHPALRPGGAAAFLVERDGDERLTLVHEVARDAGDVDVAEVAGEMRRRIAEEHGVHIGLVVLIPAGALPKTSSGKVRRDACRTQLLAGELAEIGRGEASPGMPDTLAGVPELTRASLLATSAGRRAAAVEDLLRHLTAAGCGVPVDAVDRDRPLLAAGLDSLTAQQLRQEVEERLRVALPLADILAGASLAEVAARLAGRVEADTGDLPAASEATGAAGTAGPAPLPEGVLGLTPGQQALWFLQRLSPESAAHTTAAAFRLTGPLDPTALERAFAAVVSRHPALRATFPSRDGEPVQVIHSVADKIWSDELFASLDVRELDDEAFRARLAADAHRPFDLATGPLVRLRLYRRAADEHAVLVTAHHIVTDFWSTTILGSELSALYAEHAGGPPVCLPTPGATIADVVAWHDALRGPAGEEQRRYWSRQYGAGLPWLALAARDSGAVSNRGGVRYFRLDGDLLVRLRRRAAAEGTTLYVLLLTGYQALLHRLTGQDEVVVGTPLAARTRPEFAGLVGYLMNPVVIRSRADGAQSFGELLRQTRDQVIGAIEHQDLPSALLAEQLPGLRGGLFQTMFVFNRPRPADAGAFSAALLGHGGIARAFGDLRAESLPIELHESAFHLELSLSEVDDVVHGMLRYRTEVLDGPASDRLVRQLTAVLDASAADTGIRLGSLPRATGDERARAVGEWNDTARPFDTAVPVSALIERQVHRTPGAVAVVSGGERLTYRELDDRAEHLAYQLQAAGIARGARVGVCLDRGPGIVVALLAVLKAGAAYVPVDPVNPPERIAATFADASVTAILSQRSLAAKLPAGAPVTLVDADHPAVEAAGPRPPAAPGDPAYVIYTSGSTGVPKGVEVPHRALTNYTLHAAEEYGIESTDRVLQFASIGFDASAEEIYPALVRGACLVLRTDRMLASPAEFLAACGSAGVTVLDLPTSFWHDVVVGLDRGTATLPDTLRLVVIGGERALPERVAAWRERVATRVRLVNTYGPTEATIVATAYDLTGAGAGAGQGSDEGGPRQPQRVGAASAVLAVGVPIGRPVANARAYLLDGDCQPVPVGVVGEIYLGGVGLAHGYLNRPGLTAERFVADPFGSPGGRLYRTGDLARYLPDGSIVFVARADRQVKLNGYRVELGEVESALRRLPGVSDAAVVPHIRRSQLLAYVTAVSGAPLAATDLRASLRGILPGYMVPAQYVTLPALPRTPSGKVDYAGLPMIDPDVSLSEPDAPGEPPATQEERALAAIWCDVLELTAVRRHDDFFALGGHSLLATRMLARVNDMLGLDLPLRAVFEAPTLAAFADRLRHTPRGRAAPLPRVSRDEPLPLSFVQERIWFLQQFEPGSTNYNVPRALRLRGEVDVETVTGALADIEVRHEILRTTFPDVDGEPVQQIHEPRGIPVALVDRRGLPEPEREIWLRDYILTAGQEPFDLATGPLLRVTLVRLADDEYVLVIVEHHLIHDGWAQGVFLRDFLKLYEARATGHEPHLPELPIQYADFAVWQRRTIQGERLESLLDHWRGRLAGAPPVLRLPTDRPRPRVLTSHGGQEELFIDADLARALRSLGRDHDATLFMTMFGAFVALLHGQSGQDDIVVGAGIANRQRPELENLLGMIINTVLLRTDLSGDPSFLELLHRVRDTCLDAYAHQDMPFEKLVERLRPARSLSHMPLFQVMFSFLDTPMPPLRLPGVTLEVLDAHNRSAKFDLNAVIIPNAEQRFRDGGTVSGGEPAETIAVLLEYNADLFEPATIRAFLDRYEELLRMVVGDPGRSLGELLGRLGLPAVRVARAAGMAVATG